MVKRWTIESLIKRFKEIHGNEHYDYSLIATYENNHKPLPIKCNIHDYLFYQASGDHIKGRGCVYCGRLIQSKKVKLTKEQFIEKSNKIHNNFYDYSLVEYIGIFNKIKIICPVHGIFLQTPSSHLNNESGCKQCHISRVTQSLENFIYKAKKKHNNFYSYENVANFQNSQSLICITCPKHGDFWQKASQHIFGQGCWECGKEKIRVAHLKTNEEFLVDANKIHNNEYAYLENYKGNKRKIEIKHKKCGNVFKQKPNDHLDGHGCPYCNMSSGEKEVQKLLEEFQIKYECQKRFKGCKDKYPLIFDFYLSDYNICLEYDGQQHFEITKFIGNAKFSLLEAEEKLKWIQSHDQIKNKFCTDNNITLIRISYLEKKNIRQILSNIIAKSQIR